LTRLRWCKRLKNKISTRNSIFSCNPFLSSGFAATNFNVTQHLVRMLIKNLNLIIKIHLTCFYAKGRPFHYLPFTLSSNKRTQQNFKTVNYIIWHDDNNSTRISCYKPKLQWGSKKPIKHSIGSNVLLIIITQIYQ
jgi:hypothetical protein